MTKKEWLIILVMYFSFWAYLAIDKYKQKKMLEEAIKSQDELPKLSKGDRVITVAGIYGRVDEIKGQTIILEIDREAKMEVSKNSILNKVV